MNEAIGDVRKSVQS